MPERVFTSRVIVLGLGCLIFLAVAVMHPDARLTAVSLYEDGMLLFFPSAERASAYGFRHLDSANAWQYDIDRAEKLYQKAATIDPKYPLVHHQLARIAFLRGHFPRALALINKEIELGGNTVPHTFYIRALIEGFMGSYSAAAKDYEHFLDFEPENWAALNDYTWILLKLGAHQGATNVASEGLAFNPGNPWLLNARAIALYELGKYDDALLDAEDARTAFEKLTAAEWLRAYPGNDPRVASKGLATFEQAIRDNINKIELARGQNALQF